MTHVSEGYWIREMARVLHFEWPLNTEQETEIKTLFKTAQERGLIAADERRSVPPDNLNVP